MNNKENNKCPFFDQAECIAFSGLVDRLMEEDDVRIHDNRAAFFLKSVKKYYCLVQGEVERCCYMQEIKRDGNVNLDNMRNQ